MKAEFEALSTISKGAINGRYEELGKARLS